MMGHYCRIEPTILRYYCGIEPTINRSFINYNEKKGHYHDLLTKIRAYNITSTFKKKYTLKHKTAVLATIYHHVILNIYIQLFAITAEENIIF